jgi:hypothetical protein
MVSSSLILKPFSLCYKKDKPLFLHTLTQSQHTEMLSVPFSYVKLPRISTIVKLGLRNPRNVSLYSTSTAPTLVRKPWNPSLTDLYRRISPVGNPRLTIVPILEQWIAEGQTVTREPLLSIIKELRYYKRYVHALEVSLTSYYKLVDMRTLYCVVYGLIHSLSFVSQKCFDLFL